MTPAKDALPAEERVLVLTRIAKLAKRQGSWHLAAKKFTQVNCGCWGAGHRMRDRYMCCWHAKPTEVVWTGMGVSSATRPSTILPWIAHRVYGRKSAASLTSLPVGRVWHLCCCCAQAGDKIKAMKALLRSGDTEKIVFFAGR
jgi:hypothetical protein